MDPGVYVGQSGGWPACFALARFGSLPLAPSLHNVLDCSESKILHLILVFLL